MLGARGAAAHHDHPQPGELLRARPADLMLGEPRSTRSVPVASLAMVAAPLAGGQTAVETGDTAAWAPTTASRGPAGPGFERERIVLALSECAGNQTRAARLLGISRAP